MGCHLRTVPVGHAAHGTQPSMAGAGAPRRAASPSSAITYRIHKHGGFTRSFGVFRGWQRRRVREREREKGGGVYLGRGKERSVEREGRAARSERSRERDTSFPSSPPASASRLDRPLHPRRGRAQGGEQRLVLRGPAGRARGCAGAWGGCGPCRAMTCAHSSTEETGSPFTDRSRSRGLIFPLRSPSPGSPRRRAARRRPGRRSLRRRGRSRSELKATTSKGGRRPLRQRRARPPTRSSDALWPRCDAVAAGAQATASSPSLSTVAEEVGLDRGLVLERVDPLPRASFASLASPRASSGTWARGRGGPRCFVGF